jgi:glycine/D-amino acid oxidase-like deaminating enzyme
MKNNSPWIAQLKLERSTRQFSGNIKTNSLVIGGGIAGITTAFYILQKTSQSVILLEADIIAHGATGHNAGQVTSYFERHFVELVEDFGLEMAAAGQAAIEGAWELLDEIISITNISVPLYKFTGYAGFSTLEQLIFRLEEEKLREQSGLPVHTFFVANDPLLILRIPEEFSHLYTVVSEQRIMDLLETDDTSYKAVKCSTKGCLNSALFCEQLVEWMEKHYSNRFTVYEHSPVRCLRLQANQVIAENDQGEIVADEAILCTNGFENISLINELGVDINGRFHETVSGTIGYMAGYVSPEDKSPIAISYFEKEHNSRLVPYIYLTRRPSEQKTTSTHNLTCIGGPESELDDKLSYNRHEHVYPKEAQKNISSFLQKNHRVENDNLEYNFLWHGLMGYTSNGVRLIGQEPCNKNLYYNLGCNGIGILPSIYGAWRIAELLKGTQLPPSMFDVLDKRCEVIPNDGSNN